MNAKPAATRVLEGVCGLLMAAMVILLFVQVATRYLFQSPPEWTEELARAAFVYLTFIGAAVAVARRAHLKVEALTAVLPPAARVVLRIVSRLLAIFFSVVVAWQGALLVGQLSGQTLVTVPISKGLVFAAVPIGAALMLAYEVVRLRDELRSWSRRGEPPPEAPPTLDQLAVRLD